MKLLESRKLFYAEYLYKLVFRNELSNIFRSDLQKKEKLSFARQELDRLTEDRRWGRILVKKAWRTDIPIANKDYLDAMTTYSALKQADEYKIRIDPYSSVSLFSNNKEFLISLGNRLSTHTVELWQPDAVYVELLKSKTKIQIVDEPTTLPLKVWFNSTRVNTDFANWIRANRDKCKIGKTALESLEQYGYLNGLYIYLRDEKILNLVTLLAGSSIRSVEKLVYRGDIDKY